MAISFIAAGTVQRGANPTVPVPAGYAQYDLLVLIVTSGSAVTTPAGWTVIQSATSQEWCAYKIAEASESSVAVTASGATTTSVMIAYRGAANIDAQSTVNLATSSSTIATNTFATTVGSTVILSYYSTATGSDTWTAPGSTTTRVNASPTASFRGLLIVDESKATAGTTTARTATLTTTSISYSLAFDVAATNSTGDFFSMF